MKALKTVFWLAVLAGLVYVFYRAYQKQPMLVDTATIRRGTLRVTADDDGRTRVRERYTISAPIRGRLLRTALRAGDAVKAGETLIAEFEPIAPGLLDARSRREAEARLRRAEAAFKEAEARAAQAQEEHRYAKTELARVRKLVETGTTAAEELDRAIRDERRTFQGERAGQFAVQVATYELELTRASLVESGAPPTTPDGGKPAPGAFAQGDAGQLLLRSPIRGRVLRVFEESARTMEAGTAILEVGNTTALEVVADFLSQEAVKIRPGMDVFVDGWGGDGSLHGRVRVIEPGGFTKVSALGVEEQRVNVVVDLVGESSEWAALGDGYRVELRVVLWQSDDVLLVPTGALFREGEAWCVFAMEAGRAVRRDVVLGRQSGLAAQIESGLDVGDEVVLYPSELIDEGALIEPR